MKLTFADMISVVQQDYHNKQNIKYGLETYWSFAGGKKMTKNEERVTESGVSLFLDSGAFSAWSKGVEINLPEYIEFCKKHLENLDVIAVLDVIPGQCGQGQPSPDQIELAAQTSWNNYQTMLEAGLPKDKLLPCFHFGEDFKWLEKYLGCCSYLALGAIAKQPTITRIQWLDQCMERCTDSSGYPKIKLHGFGVTAFSMMRRYPWYSVDSTSWIMMSRFGAIFVPIRRNGEWVYDVDPKKVAVSEKSPKQEKLDLHYDSMNDSSRSTIKQYIEEKGFTVEGARSDYKVRDQLNIIFFKDFEKTVPPYPTQWTARKQKGFF